MTLDKDGGVRFETKCLIPITSFQFGRFYKWIFAFAGVWFVFLGPFLFLGQLLSHGGTLEFTGIITMAVWNWDKTRRVEGTGLMSYDMLNSTQNIPCIGYGATANRKGGAGAGV
jgi:hypothetical protein